MVARKLPIFPLPLVLFPGTPQLLHIFEPRYRQMLSDCEAGDRVFGISFTRQVPDTDSEPTKGDVGCMAHLRTVRHLPDGRANVLAVGGRRYVLGGYVATDRLYRIALVEFFDDDVDEADDEDLESLAASVRHEFIRLTEVLAELSDGIAPSVEVPDNPRQLSFYIAAALEIPPPAKQKLLELRSTAARLRDLRAILRELSKEVTRRLDVHRHAKRNGRTGSAATLDR